MSNLVVCCDGTWNTEDQMEEGVPTPTNVVRLYHAVSTQDAQGVEQKTYYHPGVGTGPGLLDKAIGGGLGEGLDLNIKSAYRWVCDHYQAGDQLYLFGFSRGAYTARSLSGLLTHCGILDLTGLNDADLWQRIDKAYEDGYRNRKKDWAGKWALKQTPADVSIHFIGVWDTVGALGIPDDMVVFNLLIDFKSHTFHDTALCPAINHARHAVAIDEQRASFSPTLWTDIGDRDVKQIWFPGVHSDVGGGYLQTGLSDGALLWMLTEAQGCGLQFNETRIAQIKPEFQDICHDSVTGIFKYMRTQPRSLPQLDSDAMHVSVRQRRADPPITEHAYRPSQILKQGESATLRIYAAQKWNDTGFYLEKQGKYRFTATGEWMDGSIKCGPTGSDDGKFSPAEAAQVVMSLWGQVEKMAKSMIGNQNADFKGTKRIENLPWLALIGVIANGGNPKEDGTPEAPETFLIGNGCEHTVKDAGYFYAFANDAWNLYQDNRGSVTLTIERLA